MNELPKVSVVLPVYNGERFLLTALDSIVNQSYKNIEVIAVNSESTDNSLKLLEEYAKFYPQIKIYTIPHEKYAGGTRKFGYNVATGEYITTCDCDDRLDLRAVERMMNVILSHDYDIVMAPNYESVNGGVRKVHECKRKSIDGYLLDTNPAMWAKLIRRDFYLSHQPINPNYPFEDSIYHFTVFPYAKIGYCKYPNYYYYRLLTSCSAALSVDSAVSYMSSFDYIMDNLPPEFERIAFFGVIRWYINNITSRWIITDQLIKRIKKYWPRILDNKEYFLQQGERIYNLAEQYSNLPDTPMPSVVYINGFGEDKDFLIDRISELRSKAFYDGCKVVVMDENNCDPKENELVRRANEAENWEFVGGYFALKNIYDNGGIYLHKRIKLEAPLNCVRYYRSFFARMSHNSYSDCIFGGMAGNEIFKSILDTYTESFYSESFYPLAARINNILVSKYYVPMGTSTEFFNYPTVVFSPSVTLFPADREIVFPPLHLCYHDFSDMAGEEGVYTAPLRLLQAGTAPASGAIKKKAGAYNRYERRFKEMKKWKRGVVLYFMDRKLFKIKAKKNLAPYPLVYKTARAAYKLTHKGER